MARRPFFRRFPHFAVLRGSSRPAAGTKGAPIPAAPLYATPPSQNKNTVIKNSPGPCTRSVASSGLSKGRVKAVLHSATETPPSRRKNTALRGSILVGKKVEKNPSANKKLCCSKHARSLSLSKGRCLQSNAGALTASVEGTCAASSRT